MNDAVVMWSGGAASYSAAKRAVARFGADRVRLLFCDVGEEDESTYRSVQTAPAKLGVELVSLGGESVWELFNREGMMGKPGAGHCSRVLKRERAKTWVEQNCEPDQTLMVIGLTWEEMQRAKAPTRYWAPFSVWLPMTEEPWITKDQQIAQMERDGVPVPDLYRIGGFMHANCGGACVKAGHGQWLRLLEVRPEVFERWEKNEDAFREKTGKDVSILRDRRGGPVKPLTLRALRERREAGNVKQEDLFAGGAGCGCFIED